MTDRLEIDVGEHGRTSALAYRAVGEIRVNATLVLAHGAGAGYPLGMEPIYAGLGASLVVALAGRAGTRKVEALA